MFTPMERAVETASTLPSKLDRKAREISTSLTERATRLVDRSPSTERAPLDPDRKAKLRRRRERTLLVEPHLGGWAITVHGTGEIERVVSSREIACLEARRLAEREGRRLILRGESGEIERILCYT